MRKQWLIQKLQEKTAQTRTRDEALAQNLKELGYGG